MKKRETFFVTMMILLLILSAAVWLFVHQVSGQLWEQSIRTITESTHQGTNALNIQLETDLDALETMWGNIVQSEPEKLGLVLNLYNIVEPDVMLYFPDRGSVRENVRPDEEVFSLLAHETLERGILDAHVSSVTGETVFNIFERVSLGDGREAYLVKEYRTREIARQFTLSFYDNTGFSYLVNHRGDIMVRPEHQNGNETVRNLFDMMSGQENDEQMIASFRENIHEQRSGWAEFLCQGTGMVFCYEPFEADPDWLLVSIIPKEVITRQTKSILQKTMVFSTTIAGIILIMTIVFYGMKMRENEKHTRELQEALHVTDEANHAKGLFLMNMSHDIRTPLNAIIGMTAIAEGNIQDRSRLEDCLKKIRISGVHLLSLVNDVMDMSQLEQGRMILKEETIRLPVLFREVTDSMKAKAQEAGLTMEVSALALNNEVVKGDPYRVRQVMFNIIDNAVKYTPSGGHVSLELTQSEECRDGYGIYRFCCTDTGIGMNPEFLERVFLPFERARNTTASKIAGTGVGLAIIKNLLDLLGGSISVTSEPGKGSSFTVELPMKLAEETPMNRQAQKKSQQELQKPQKQTQNQQDQQESQTQIQEPEQKTQVQAQEAQQKMQMQAQEAQQKMQMQAQEAQQKAQIQGRESQQKAQAQGQESQQKAQIQVQKTQQKDQEKDQTRQNQQENQDQQKLQHQQTQQNQQENQKQQEQKTQNQQKEEKQDRQEQAQTAQHDEEVLPSQDDPSDYTTKRVLLVEDNELNMEIAEELIGITGVQVEGAWDGQEAVQLFQEHPAGYYDLIFMDIQMPVMDGYEATRQIRRLRREDSTTIPIIALSANALVEDINNSLQAGMNAHVAKPIDLESIEKILKQYL